MGQIPEADLVLDFDGTIFDTFGKGPAGTGVEEAYEMAVEELFGLDARTHYREEGGVQNRSPREVIDGLVTSGFIDVDKAVTATDSLVTAKISNLCAQIGQRDDAGRIWPPPTTGFADFWLEMSVNSSVRLVVLSSGHHKFICQTFEVHALPQPDLVVCDDDLRPHGLSKPDVRVWNFMVTCLTAADRPMRNPVYVGDDPIKDGQLAMAAGVPFRLFDALGESDHPGAFSDWRNLRFPAGKLAAE